MKTRLYTAVGAWGCSAIVLAILVTKTASTGDVRMGISHGPDQDAVTVLVQDEQVGGGPAGATDQAVYLIQRGTNLTDWQNLLAVPNWLGEGFRFAFVDVWSISNPVGFYRTIRLGILDDASPPVWTNGVQGSVTFGAGGLRLGWA
ncbi:MAG: hypothetical protein N2255_05300, partial [Kiritimatiellae bacterium]|nr:hypothetical protein [Kiritimatiellia bacterium]